MKTPWMEMTVREFQAALASSSPTPGGGTAAAISLGQASALTIMVCDLTIGKDKWSEGWPIAEKAMLLAVKIMTRAGELADEDSDAFDDVMQSFRLPKDTEEEKSFEERSNPQSNSCSDRKTVRDSKISTRFVGGVARVSCKRKWECCL